jgi:hypothetical protein
MPLPNYFLFSMFLCIVTCGSSVAQKDIRIDDSLASHADKFTVKPGSQGFGKVWTIKFGDYAVVGGKMGWTTTSSRSNLLNTKTESKSTEKFSFTLASKIGDTAWVNAARSIQTKQINEIALFLGFSFGENEVLQSSDNFTAFIRLNGDSSKEWALYMNITSHRDSLGDYSFFMSDGHMTLFVSSIPEDQKSSNAFAMNAAGYGFSENEVPRAALQYHGAGMMGGNRIFIWIDRGLDSKTKLALAAAMTSILQLKLSLPAAP